MTQHHNGGTMLKMGKIKNYKGFSYYRITGSVNGNFWRLASTNQLSHDLLDTRFKNEKEVKAIINKLAQCNY